MLTVYVQSILDFEENKYFMHFTVLIFNLLKKDFWSSHISETVNSTTNLWGTLLTWHLSSLASSSSVKVYIIIFFTEATGPDGIKIGRNVNWMVLRKVEDMRMAKVTSAENFKSLIGELTMHFTQYNNRPKTQPQNSCGRIKISCKIFTDHNDRPITLPQNSCGHIKISCKITDIL
jgi:hypothetical protein